MAIFPDIHGVLPEVTDRWNTRVSDMESGKETRTQTWVFPKADIQIDLSLVSLAESKSILDFFHARKGARYTFRYVWPTAEAKSAEYVGQGDGVETTFTLPCTAGEEASVLAYVNGVLTEITFSEGTGADGLDQIVFASAPAEGSLITADFTGKWSPSVRFEDSLGRRYVSAQWLRMNGLTLKQDRNA